MSLKTKLEIRKWQLLPAPGAPGLTRFLVVLDGKNKYEVRQVADMPCGRPHFVIVDLTDEKVIYEIQRDELCTSAICCDNVFYYLLGK